MWLRSNIKFVKIHLLRYVLTFNTFTVPFLCLSNTMLHKENNYDQAQKYWLLKSAGVIYINGNRSSDEKEFYTSFIKVYNEISSNNLDSFQYNLRLFTFIQSNITKNVSIKYLQSDFDLSDQFKLLDNTNISLLLSLVNGKTKEMETSHHLPKKLKETGKPLTEADVAYGVMQYWNQLYWYYPYKDNLSDNLDSVLCKVIIPKLNINEQYLRTYLEIIYSISNKLEDCHSSVWYNGYQIQYGYYAPMLVVETINNKTIVVASGEEKCPKGTEIILIDSIDVEVYKNYLREYTSCSTIESKEYAINRNLFRTNKVLIYLTVKTPEGELNTIKLDCTADGASYSYKYYYPNIYFKQNKAKLRVPIPGNSFRKINDSVGYVDLKYLYNKDVKKMFNEFSEFKYIIFDLRCYPNATMDRIFQHLTYKNQVFIYFKKHYPFSYNKFYFKKGNLLISRIISIFNKQYKGGMIILTNEITQSQGETMLLGFKSINGRTTLIGSNTAGTNGNITYQTLPFGVIVSYTSVGVYDINMKTYQLNGIPPDISIMKTIEDIVMTRDPVLNAAIRHTSK